jgi:phosphatidylglycerophosphatase A
VENNASVRTVQGLLRRLKFVAPDARTVSFLGVDPAVAEEAVRREKLVLVPGDPDGMIVWRPGETVFAPPAARAVTVVGAAVGSAPLPEMVSDRPAQTHVPLREWVTGWFAPGSLAARLLAPILVSPAVGDRPTRVNVPGSREWIFAAAPLPAGPSESGRRAKLALITGGGCGFFPIMPATLACAVMLPPAVAIYLLAGETVFFLVTLAVALAATGASVALEKWSARELLAEDPREFVLDEFAGMAVTWAFLPPGAPSWALGIGFLLFRVFDIFKWGVDWVEKLPVPGRIVWDDVLAGLYAGVALWLVCRFLA